MVLLGTCNWWISTLGMTPIRHWEPNQNPSIMMTICARFFRYSPETTSLKGASLFSLDIQKEDSGTFM
ncbi:MAG TPA: hypothetical protein VMU81_12785 [Acetobacteraceae bacterium]|jgi:hypothetical protein|nr:hypothetical protein [Acetobacteraceae bacterium]